MKELQKTSMIPSIFATEWAPGNLQTDKYQMSLEGIFKKVRDLGASYTHIVYRWNFEKGDVSHIRDLVSKYNIHISSVHSLTRLNHPCSPEDIAMERGHLMDTIGFARTLNSRFVTCNFGENPSRDEATAIRDCRKNYADCFKTAADEGITILAENTCTFGLDEITATAEGVRKLIEGVDSPAFKFHFDPGNMHSAGEEAYPYGYEHLKEHIRLVHAKDMAKYDPSLDLHRRAKDANKHLGTYTDLCISVPLGMGAINWEGLFASLIQDGYEGFFDIEPHTVEDKLDEYYKAALDYFARHTHPLGGQHQNTRP